MTNFTNLRRLLYTSGMFCFSLPRNEKTNWIGRKFSIKTEKDPALKIIFTEVNAEDEPSFKLKSIITCIQVGKDPALRIPKGLAHYLLDIHDLKTSFNSETEKSIFKCDISLYPHIATFTLLSTEEVETKEKRRLRIGPDEDIKAPSFLQQKLSEAPEYRISFGVFSFSSNAHISTIPKRKLRRYSALCGAQIGSRSFEDISEWGKSPEYQFCSLCKRKYDENCELQESQEMQTVEG